MTRPAMGVVQKCRLARFRNTGRAPRLSREGGCLDGGTSRVSIARVPISAFRRAWAAIITQLFTTRQWRIDRQLQGRIVIGLKGRIPENEATLCDGPRVSVRP